MRPRIRRSETREGQDRKDNRTTGYNRTSGERPVSGPRRSAGPGQHAGRPEHGNRPGYRSDSRTGGRGGRPGSGGRSGYGARPGFGGKPGAGQKPGFHGKGGRPFRDGERPDRQTAEHRSFEHRIRSERPGMDRPRVPQAPAAVKEDDGLVRLNKFIANSGICSRREADEYIAAGLVTVNGEVVTEMGVKVNPAQDDIRFNGERLRGEKKVYVLLNKPKDFVTTMSDPHAEKNVMQLISREMCPERIFPVGRLDRSTTGVLLLTNDGELAEKLTHPSFQKKKIYQVTLDKNLRPEDMDRLVQGVDLEDGPAYADEVAYNGDDRSVVGIEIHSGRNRIVRRMFEALGYRVRKLDRVYFAGLTKKNLRRGQWRFLSDEEVTMLKLNFYE
ncbi:MAG TPA: rRNA pseudouridine synthase [Candidatus Coprenecus merdigallinarum]|nr:rRNA pseudouridine synthase [Candidatus Coprenecus merdigallinarum]